MLSGAGALEGVLLLCTAAASAFAAALANMSSALPLASPPSPPSPFWDFLNRLNMGSGQDRKEQKRLNADDLSFVVEAQVWKPRRPHSRVE